MKAFFNYLKYLIVLIIISTISQSYALSNTNVYDNVLQSKLSSTQYNSIISQIDNLLSNFENKLNLVYGNNPDRYFEIIDLINSRINTAKTKYSENSPQAAVLNYLLYETNYLKEVYVQENNITNNNLLAGILDFGDNKGNTLDSVSPTNPTTPITPNNGPGYTDTICGTLSKGDITSLNSSSFCTNGGVLTGGFKMNFNYPNDTVSWACISGNADTSTCVMCTGPLSRDKNDIFNNNYFATQNLSKYDITATTGPKTQFGRCTERLTQPVENFDGIKHVTLNPWMGKINGNSSDINFEINVGDKYGNKLSVIPTRSGYEFLGWALTWNYYDGIQFYTQDMIAVGDTDIKLYAVWKVDGVCRTGDNINRNSVYGDIDYMLSGYRYSTIYFSPCIYGEKQWIDNVGSDGEYNWTCKGTGGGVDVTCSAIKGTQKQVDIYMKYAPPFINFSKSYGDDYSKYKYFVSNNGNVVTIITDANNGSTSPLYYHISKDRGTNFETNFEVNTAGINSNYVKYYGDDGRNIAIYESHKFLYISVDYGRTFKKYNYEWLPFSDNLDLNFTQDNSKFLWYVYSNNQNKTSVYFGSTIPSPSVTDVAYESSTYSLTLAGEVTSVSELNGKFVLHLSNGTTKTVNY